MADWTNQAEFEDFLKRFGITQGWGGGSGSLPVPSTPAYQRLAYNNSSGLYVPEKALLVNLVDEFGVSSANSGVGAQDNWSIINAALVTLAADGLCGYLPPDVNPYKGSTALQIGNGIAAPGTPTASTWTGGLVGPMMPTALGASQWSNLPQNLTATLKWVGGNTYNGALIYINGPLSGYWLENLLFDGNSTYSNGPLYGMQTQSTHNGKIKHLCFINMAGGIKQTTIGSKSVNGWNNSWDHYEDISIGMQGRGALATDGWLLDEESGISGNGNTCYTKVDGLWIENSGSPAGTCYGIRFRGCDSNHFRNVNIAAGGFNSQIAFDYTGNTAWPAGNRIDVIEMGGASVGAVQVGTPGTGTAPNTIEHINMVNGQPPNPYLGNSTWNSPYIQQLVTLVAGTKTFTAQVLTMAPAALPVAQLKTPGGTPGFVSCSVSGTTCTVTSTSNTDTGTYLVTVYA